jgi:transcription initiation factor TFIIE subunit alpha
MKLEKKDRTKIYDLINELVKKIAGKTNETVTSLLYEKKNVNEFKLADKLKLTINQTRNILYKLLNYNILTFTRKKDKRKGWYTYFWTLETDKALEALKKIKLEEIKTFENLMKSRELKQYYVCPNECLELTTETAMGHQFSCPECGSLLQPADEHKKNKEIANCTDKFKKELEIIESYLAQIAPKIKPIEKVKKKKISKKVDKKKSNINKKIVKKVKKHKTIKKKKKKR